MAAAAAFLQRSVELTREPGRRANRALGAAEANLHAGAFDVALRLLVAAEAGALDEFQRARVDALRAQITFSSGSPSDAPLMLLNAARRVERLDVELARRTYLDAWGAAVHAGGLADRGLIFDVSRAALAAPQPTHPPQAPDLLLDGLALLITEGRAAAAPLLRRAVSAVRAGEVSVGKGLQWSSLAATAAVVLWDFESWRDMVTVSVELARDAGALAFLPLALSAQGVAITLRGDFATAASVNAEFDTVTETTSSRFPPYGSILLAACRGREAEARALIDAAITDATAAGEGPALQYAHLMSAILYDGLGRYHEALPAAQQATSVKPEIHVSVWALPEEIEAAARSGEVRLAADGLQRLAEFTHGSESDWALGIEARCRALLSEGEVAEQLYGEAIDRLSRTRLRPELARAHLLYGEWLRREGRRIDARVQLRTAHDMLGMIGMEAFAERARRELLATGEKVRKRTIETRDDLTSQEEQIARMAREGLSNPEIAARLFISPRTVEWHLRKVFTKQGISSRRGLREALPGTRVVPAIRSRRPMRPGSG